MDKKIYVSFCRANISVVDYDDYDDFGYLIIKKNVRYWNMANVQGLYGSIDSLIERLYYWGFSDNKKDYSFHTNVHSGVIVSSILVDEFDDIVEEGSTLYNDWVSGKIHLYSADLYCEVSIIDERPITDEDAKEFGIPVY